MFRNSIAKLSRYIKHISSPQITLRYISTSKPKKQLVSRGVTLIFGKYLLITNVFSSAFLLFIGDLIRQEMEFRQNKLQKRYDFKRSARMFTVGLALGPIHHYYYVWIARQWPAKTLKIIALKIGLDQFVMSPICIACFFYGMGALERKSLEKSNEELVEKFQEVYLMDWMVWPPTQFLNFYYIPVKYQVLYINAVTMFYDVFLSYIKHRDSFPSVNNS